MAAAYNKSESVDASSKRASETAVDEEVNLVELQPEEIQYTASVRPQKLSCKTSMCCRLRSYTCSRHKSTQRKGLKALPFHVGLPGGGWRSDLQRAPRGCSESAVVVHLSPGRASQNYLHHFSRFSQT